MPTISKRSQFFETDEGLEIQRILQAMEADVSYNTESTYVADGVQFPDHILSFMEKHKRYILANPAMDARSYVANLRLKTKLR